MPTTRNSALDVLRIAATIAVVVFHVLTSSAYHDPTVSALTQICTSAIAEALCWHVPIFFMITGFIWLGVKKESGYKRIFLHIQRFVVILFTIGFAYAIMERFYTLRQFSPSPLLGGLLDVLNGNLWDHMWFLYSIIGVYLFLPIVQPLFNLPSSKNVVIMLGLLFVFTVLAPILADLGYDLPISFPISAPAFYVCAGGFIAKIDITSKRMKWLTAALFISSCTATFLIAVSFPSATILFPLLTCIAAVSLFLTVMDFPISLDKQRYLFAIADCTFGIYLLHPFFINVMIKVLHIYPLRFCLPLGMIFACAVLISLSFIVTYILRKFRWIRQFL